MLIHDQHQDGRVFAFEFDGVWLTRRRVLSIVKAIPGVRIIRDHADGSDDGGFCEFDVDEARFVARPAAGGGFWVGPKRESHLPEVERVRHTFERKGRVNQTFIDGVLLGLITFTASVLITIVRRSPEPLHLGLRVGPLVALAYWIAPWWCWGCLRVSFRRSSGDRDRCVRCGNSRASLSKASAIPESTQRN